MEQEKLDEILKKHGLWLKSETGGERADLRWANLRWANLNRADLSRADLRGVDLDFSCLPLWCGSLDVHFDDRQLYQIAYHLVRSGLYSKNASDETKDELLKLIDFANKFHRAGQCGEIELEEMM